ncbi:unnamed protein product [Cylicostephanus goldi]|uniref:Uncharacterized protein n=1 Tax=Cylicostephanus goldi TaxID=71465 RepID=A0A3P6TTV0_CYLGO|nr:unnamed protein product [Cylicostephanus goldi]
MIDEFGDFFDRSGYRYQLRGSAIAYKVHRNNTNVTFPHIVQLSAKITDNRSIRTADAEKVAEKVYQTLSMEGAVFSKHIELITP